MNENNLDKAIDIILRKYEEELNRSKNINDKAFNLLTLKLTIIALFSTVFSFIWKDSIDFLNDIKAISGGILAVIFYILIITSSFKTFTIIKPKVYQHGPGIKILREMINLENGVDFKIKIFDSYSKSFHNNYSINERKAKSLIRQMLLIIISIFLGLLAILFLTISI